MRALTFPGGREVEYLKFPDPTPGPGEIVLEIKASGFCGSDLHYYRRPKGTPTSARHQYQNGPVIGGHEPCGTIAAIGADVPESAGRVGDRVMVHHYAGCASCSFCRSGWQQLCQEIPIRSFGNNDHGAHAQYMKVPAATVLPLPDKLSFAAGAAISCGTGTAYGAMLRLNLLGNQAIAIFGQGPVGLAATQLAKAMGAEVIAVDINSQRLALAKKFGADAVVDASEIDPVVAVKELTRGRGADASLDASGSQAGRVSAIKCLKVWGKVCFVGEGGELKTDVSSDLIRKQITIMGSWTFSSIIQSECARFVADRKVDVDAIFTHQWKFDQGQEAYRLFDQQATGKAVFLM
ncbi:iditol 2-dehydrogenase [Cupriavidus sp. SK-4]|uniref:zinc-dependent alcohol dehydrogenase family protein n=1 Tax=Cupriavidus sp. SK-4 TaxID=574750 RepID=UPI00044D392D|nr:zinc-binding dehydrogenase [Cupriavidus sp. SK-4]EYS97662.1 iditol 2-dehydrogenase [Cupriavidus sp. SK-4]